MTKFRLIHVCEDEKFINSAIDQFEAVYPDKNQFLVVVKDVSLPLINNIEQLKIKKANLQTVNTFLEMTTPNDVVIFHSLPDHFHSLVQKIPTNITIVWLCFGFEVYNDPNFYPEKKLLDTITNKRYKFVKQNFKSNIKDILRPYYRFFKPKLPLTKRENKIEALKRVDYLGCSFSEEFRQVTRYIGMKKKFFRFWYFPLEKIVEINYVPNKQKKSILIGHSGFKTSNHLDVFEKIKKYSFDNFQLLIPLSYGDLNYINQIKNTAKNIFGKKASFLENFIPLDQYNLILQDVAVAVLNNRRQQAVGNTIALIWYGAKVFLSNKNPFYHYLRRIGIHVFCYENQLSENALTALSPLEIEHNRCKLWLHLNEKKLINELKEQLLKISETRP